MQFKEFDYDVLMLVEISGHELLFLQKQSQRHYDGVCRSAGAVGGFLYGLINLWKCGETTFNDWSDLDSGRTDLDRVVVCRLTGHELSILGKICELPSDTNVVCTVDFLQLLQKRLDEYRRLTDIIS